jgi:hypothetical protein
MNHKNKKPERQFVVCVRNEDCEDLEVRKIYEVLPDRLAAEDGYIRIVDESDEDYLYPAEFFLPLELSQTVETALLLAA